MVHLSASVNDKPVDVLPGASIKWYIPDTSKEMEQMQLFKGEKRKAGINWISSGQWFSRPYSYTIKEVRVLDLRNEPIKTIERRNGTIAVFAIADKPQLSQSELRDQLKEKYGYYKVRFRKQWRRDRWPLRIFKWSRLYTTIGDSAWLRKETADSYKLKATQTRTTQGTSINNFWSGGVMNRSSRKLAVNTLANTDTLRFSKTSTRIIGNGDTLNFDDQSTAFKMGLEKLEEKYSVDINKLGWINCDRFYNDKREKVNYYVNLQDSAINYYTMMVFNKLRSMVMGYAVGNKVSFGNVPMGEQVKIISIGIDKKGEAVMAMKETKINKDMFTGLQFESTSATTIKSTLRKEDNNR